MLQADLLESANTGVVAPLVRDSSIKPVQRLNPMVRVARADYVMLADKLGAALRAELREVVLSLRQREYDIRRALDIVVVGV